MEPPPLPAPTPPPAAGGSFKKAFLRRLLFGLHLASSSSPTLNLDDRKNAVRLSADAAMASARGRTRWTRALVSDMTSRDRVSHRTLARAILAGSKYETAPLSVASKTRPGNNNATYKMVRMNKIVRRSHEHLRVMRRKRKSCKSAAASYCSSSAMAPVTRSKLQVLKRLIPGGEALHGLSLLSEALDYVLCLRTQVALMHSLCKATVKV